jgi:hypothetical protein
MIWIGHTTLAGLLRETAVGGRVFVNTIVSSRIDSMHIVESEHRIIVQTQHAIHRDEIHYWRAIYGRDATHRGKPADDKRTARIDAIRDDLRRCVARVIATHNVVVMATIAAPDDLRYFDGTLDGFLISTDPGGAAIDPEAFPDEAAIVS